MLSWRDQIRCTLLSTGLMKVGGGRAAWALRGGGHVLGAELASYDQIRSTLLESMGLTRAGQFELKKTSLV